jgi:enterochelin esterase-like enzyme
MMRGLIGRTSVLLVALAVLVTGLDGAYRYWQSYYQHRGFTPVRLIAGAHSGHRLWVHFYSTALHRRYDYLVYLPPGYDPAHHRYPVFYLLHGSPGRPQVYTGIGSMGTRMDNLIHRGRMAPMILVFPDGRVRGSTFSDAEWANTRSGRYESYVLDVVHDVDHRFATVAHRGARVIAGFSSGAYGATNIALHHLGVFGNLQSWSGYYRQTRTAAFTHASPALLAANSPLDYVSRLARTLAVDPLRAFLFIGRDDNLSPQQQPMATALGREGAQVSYAFYNGGHDWQLWHAKLNRMLILASRDVTRPLPPGPGSVRNLTPGVTPLPHGIGRRHRPARSYPAPPGRRAPPGYHHRTRARRLQLVAWHVRLHLRRGGRLGLGVLLGGLLLALGAAALINLGFLFQHRGLSDRRRDGLPATVRSAFHSRVWLGGQVLGWIGFAAQVLAVAIAPLALVQAFAAGGLALSVPLAARIFGHPITRVQRYAVFLMAAGLAALPFGYGAAHDRLQSGTLAIVLGILGGLALIANIARSRGARAVAAGIFYGAADAAIKAVSVNLGPHGWGALMSGWTVVAAVGTFAGFLAFQSALAQDNAIGAISLMNGFAALAAMLCGLLAFGESLGANPAAIAVHLVAIAVVLGCVPKLAGAQAEMAEGPRTAAEPAVAAPARPAEYSSPG